MPKNLPKLILSITICLGAGILGSFFTVSAIPGWYSTLNKPSFSPPNWLFGPVWTILYILMGISLYLIWIKKTKKKEKTRGLQLFFAQLFLNALWSILFFGLHSPVLALLDIVVLWCAILFTIIEFFKISKSAAWLLVPYILWVSFASVLNLFILLLNS